MRAAAYEALAAYPLDLLETLEALRPLRQYVDLLVKETDHKARVKCQGLVGRALAHEHMRRRRWAMQNFVLYVMCRSLTICVTQSPLYST